jgi:hypothetical protein
VRDRGEAFERQLLLRSSECLPLRPGPRKARHDPFADAVPLELSDCSEDVQLQTASRRSGVDAFVQRDERNTDCREFIE